MSPNGGASGGWGARSRRRLLVLGGVALLAVLAGCGGPQPAPEVCYGCGDDGAGQALPENATTDDRVTHLVLRPADGGPPRVRTWTETDLDTAAEVRENASRREAVREAILAARNPDRAVDGTATTPTPRYGGADGRPLYPVPAFEARDLVVRGSSDGFAVEFRVAGIPGVAPAETPPLVQRGYAGAVLVDRFDVRDGRNPHPDNEGHAYSIATGRLVVHAPPGTRPVVAPESATVYEDRVVLRSLPAGTNLVFAPPGSAGTLAAHATLTADRLDWVVPDSFWVALLPTIQLALLLGGIRAGGASGTRYAVGALVLALLLTLGPLALLLGPLGLVGVGVVLVVAAALLWRAGRPEDDGDEDAGGEASAPDGATDGSRLPSGSELRAGLRPWAAPVTGVAAVAVVLTVAAAAADPSPVHGLLFLGGGLLPLVGTVGLGRLEGVGAVRPRLRRLAVLTVLVGPWLLAVGHVGGRDLPDSIETTALVLVWGTGVTLCGYVSYRLAARFSSGSD